ncbi:MAG: class I SAM-dependent methyltransferase [Limisphaerales bacterium]
MIYELKIALKTIRQEGCGSLFRKVLQYFGQWFQAVRFLGLRIPKGDSPERVVDFSFTAAGGLIYPGQIRSEYVRLATLVQERKPQVIVEIGTANGGTLVAWCALAQPRAVIVSIDLPGGMHGGGYAYWRSFIYRRFAQPEQSLHLWRADSHLPGTRERLQTLLPPQGIDFLFIDGDHTYEGVKADFEMYSPLVRKGGLVALHDICVHPPEMDCHVDQFWREVQQKYKTSEIIENEKQGGLGIGVVFFEPES